ncbi:MAG: hypothetical protein AMDU3_IPLC00004G0138 [Thermoplasmatales archaeon I-plasma]|jgi:Predicted integral membrane protein|nr:MAG: hypothetical protein AMDU3_IPLC00004G0138 [Thermoplasmatales archaeon I-plasma]
MYDLLMITILFIHVICAIFLVGSSIFVWVIVWPASSIAIPEEKQRTRFMTVMGKKYALWTNVSIILLTLTGLLLVFLYRPLYFTSFGSAIHTQWGYVLTVKIVAVALMYGILYGNNLWHGKKFPKLAEAGKFDELKRMRRISHLLSFITVALMVVIILIAEILAGVFF